MPKKKSPRESSVVFLFDIDNTLLNNDQVTADLRRRLEEDVGADGCHAYWRIFEQLRGELGYADYLGALQRYRVKHPHDQGLLTVSRFMVNYPFANRLFPNSLDAIAHVKPWGPAALLSDGDVVFQPRKAERSGLSDAVDGQVMIYTHKEKELKDVAARHPAEHYVMFDDKIRILTAMKKIWGRRLTTVFVRQGHYALDAKAGAAYPPADLAIDRIGDAMSLDLPLILSRGQNQHE
jgi:FMN phosphatase YigB (HAD superfamily)